MIGIAKAQNYSEGQVWSYKTRPGEEKSTVLIDKVETNEKLGKIYHISVDGVKVKNPNLEGNIMTEIAHLPVSEQTLNKSLTKLIGKKKPNPNYIEGYKMWKAEFDKGSAGIFRKSVAEIVEFIEESINRKP